VTNGASTDGSFSYVLFTDTRGDGGFTLLSVSDTAVFGPQLFTGTLTAPIFSTGAFAMNSGNGTLTVTAAIPEPSTWAMMIAGLAGLGALYRRRVAFAA
jgi:hypothetical protein